MKGFKIEENLESLALAGMTNKAVIHELKNLNTLIHLTNEQLQLALSQMDMEKASAYSKKIEKVSEEANKIVRFTNTLFDRYTHNSITSCSLKETLDQTLNLLEPKLTKFNVTLENKYEDFILEINPILISQVIINLISNSVYEIKKQKDPWISVNTQDKKDKLLVNIVDSGAISPTLVDQIFSPMFSTKESDGNGIGLWISKNIMKKHDGDLVCHLKDGHTCFSLVFNKS